MSETKAESHVVKSNDSVIGHLSFAFMLFILQGLLYANTLHNGFVWDDRAAIMTNRDVHGKDPMKNLLLHDFWGQNITLADSHKSYRPLTVLTYRLNYSMHGIDSMGYHAGNILIYGLACMSMYWFCLNWLPINAARVASLLFCFHPVHVEAVASIVGRADCVCGLLFLSSLCLYSKSVRYSLLPLKIARKHQLGPISSLSGAWHFLEAFYLILAFLVAIAASLAKELGVTVFAMFVVLEVAEVGLSNFCEGDENNAKTIELFTSDLRVLPKRRFIPRMVIWAQRLQRSAQDCKALVSATAKESLVFRIFYSIKYLMMRSILFVMTAFIGIYDSTGSKCFQCSILTCFSDSKSIIRVILTIVTLVLFSIARLRINGPHSLYSWTILENHITFLPTFTERSLSYAQCHFWYFFKLLFPRYLSFDYGYACIPTIHSLWDIRNLFPLSVYCLAIFVFINAILLLQWTILIAGALMLIPLIPALNILFPVGTVLAERLLFIPSAGFCIIISYFLFHPKVERYWLGEGKTRKMKAQLGATATPITKASTSSAAAAKSPVPLSSSSTPKGKGNSTTKKTPNHKSSKSPAASLSTPVRDLDAEFKSNEATSVVGNPEDISVPNNLEADSDSSKQAIVYSKIFRYFVVPICSLATIRVLSRNIEWNDELSLYRSALDVCPLSVKALSNYASLTLNDDRSMNTVIASDLASQLYSEHVAARINHAYAQQHYGNVITALSYFEDALRVLPSHGKAWGSIGTIYESLATRLQADGKTVSLLSDAAIDYIEHAIKSGYYPPSLLHVRGSISLAQGRYEEALFYLQLALRENESIKATAAVSGSVHLVDLVAESATLNQIGNALLVS